VSAWAYTSEQPPHKNKTSVIQKAVRKFIKINVLSDIAAEYLEVDRWKYIIFHSFT